MITATGNFRSVFFSYVAASGQYIRYERGLRYSRQRVRAILDAHCACGRPGSALADAGSGLIGWRHLAPVCHACAAVRPALTLGAIRSPRCEGDKGAGKAALSRRWSSSLRAGSGLRKSTATAGARRPRRRRRDAPR